MNQWVTSAAPRALILISGSVNYFYNQTGRRIAEALRAAGWTVDLTTLDAEWQGEYDWGVLINISELIFSRRVQGDGLARLREARQRCRRLGQALLECVATNWFRESAQMSAEVGTEVFLDLGLHDQSAGVPAKLKDSYRFVFNGLTPSERRTVESLREPAAALTERPIPWAVVGHQTPSRVKLVTRLVREFDARGFCYLPGLSPVTENGPHLNEQQFHRVLERSRYHVWCSHHDRFYLEGERFRAALLAGAVPIKVMLGESNWRETAAGIFDSLILDEEDFPARLQTLDFAATQRDFLEDFRRRPSLTDSLLAAMKN